MLYRPCAAIRARLPIGKKSTRVCQLVLERKQSVPIPVRASRRQASSAPKCAQQHQRQAKSELLTSHHFQSKQAELRNVNQILQDLFDISPPSRAKLEQSQHLGKADLAAYGRTNPVCYVILWLDTVEMSKSELGQLYSRYDT